MQTGLVKPPQLVSAVGVSNANLTSDLVASDTNLHDAPRDIFEHAETEMEPTFPLQRDYPSTQSRQSMFDARYQSGACAFIESDLSELNLSGLNLTNKVLLKTNLRGANLSGAILTGATLFHADLSGANLCGTNMCGIYDFYYGSPDINDPVEYYNTKNIDFILSDEAVAEINKGNSLFKPKLDTASYIRFYVLGVRNFKGADLSNVSLNLRYMKEYLSGTIFDAATNLRVNRLIARWYGAKFVTDVPVGAISLSEIEGGELSQIDDATGRISHI